MSQQVLSGVVGTDKYSLEAFDSNFAGHRVCWDTDYRNVKIRLDLTWIPRDQYSEADRFSKVVDIDDYSFYDDVFIHLDRLWGPHSIDRFASSYNA